jgi:S-adenosylmethionine synthetase
MKRYAEAVLNGHPDKFSDLIADAIVRAYCEKEPDAYVQVEVAIWSDLIFLTGFAATRQSHHIPIRDIIVALGEAIGYTSTNHIDASRYIIHNHICNVCENPTQWTSYVNDQSVVLGYACGDARTHYLPPEQFLVWYFREIIIHSLSSGLLKGHGPDGKLLISIIETPAGWEIEHLLITLQQAAGSSLFDVCDSVNQTMREAYNTLQSIDPRWITPWHKVNFLLNPNGPFFRGGSDSDNGQTGRKLVMDFYGPQTPIGGGAFYGKDLNHIDRLGAIEARQFAVNQVASGAESAVVKVSFAPGIDAPLSVFIQSNQTAYTPLEPFFKASEMRRRINPALLHYDLLKLGTFYNNELSFNNPSLV